MHLIATPIHPLSVPVVVAASGRKSGTRASAVADGAIAIGSVAFTAPDMKKEAALSSALIRVIGTGR